jgi:hypothetical protein
VADEAEKSLLSLVDAAKRTERARSRKANSEERLALWTALVESRWSIVESIEHDGKRMLLACRNEPHPVVPAAIDGHHVLFGSTTPSSCRCRSAHSVLMRATGSPRAPLDLA